MIDLSKPIKGEWRGRGFGRRYVWTYQCPLCNKTLSVIASSFLGRKPVPGLGGLYCDCEGKRGNQRQAETS
jgi:hypothetical protein